MPAIHNAPTTTSHPTQTPSAPEGHNVTTTAAIDALVNNRGFTVPEARAKVAKLRDLAIDAATTAESMQATADDAHQAAARAQMLTDLADTIERRYLHTAGFRPVCDRSPAGALDPRTAVPDDAADLGDTDTIGDHDATVCLHPRCRCKSSARGYCTGHAKAISAHGHPDGPGASHTRPMSLRSIELSADPLRELAARRGGVRTMIRNDASAAVAAAMEIRIRRAIERGTVTVDAADEIAIHGLGMLPQDLWGDEWWQIEDRFWPVAGEPQQTSLLG